jgi:hypothetical protein
MFTEVEGEYYCSLHIPCDECGVIHDEENELMTIKEESNEIQIG